MAFGIRGARGAAINRQLAATLAEQMARLAGAAPVLLVVTASEESAGAANRVSDDERAAVLETLDRTGVSYAVRAHAGRRRATDARRMPA